MLPFLNGERTPDLPLGKGVLVSIAHFGNYALLALEVPDAEDVLAQITDGDGNFVPPTRETAGAYGAAGQGDLGADDELDA